jgi:hypothetical protein
MKISERIRRLLRLPHPELSRAEMATRLNNLSRLTFDMAADLRKACLHGYWRLDHPLSALCPEHMKTRHPKLTEEEIETQLRRILSPERIQLLDLSKNIVVNYPASVQQLPQ